MKTQIQKLKLKFIFAIVLAILGGLFVFQNHNAKAAAGIYKTINFQGKLVANADGTNVANGNYDFVFAIYSQQAPGGAAIWTETRTGGNQVAVNDGIFQVNLGSVTALPGSVDFNTDNIYLGIKVGADVEMTPRVQFTASPYAFNADKLDGLDESAFALLAGRAGGQMLYGGTANSENLTLGSTSAATKGKILFGTSGYDEVNNRLGLGTTAPSFKLDITTALANDRGLNILNSAATGTNYGIYSALSGAATTNIGAFLSVSGAATNKYGLQISAMTSAGVTTNKAIVIGNISGSTGGSINTGIEIGTIAGTATTNQAFVSGAISGTATNAYGINLGTLTGGTATNAQVTTGVITVTGGATNYGLNIGGLTGTSNGSANYGIAVGALNSTGTTTNNYGLSLGAVSGATTANYGINLASTAATASATNYGLNIGGLTGTAASSTNYGMNIGTMSATGTATYGIKITGPTGAATSNYGLNITSVSGATHNSALEIGTVATGAGTFAIYSSDTNGSYLAGNLGIGTAPTTTTFLDLSAATTTKSNLRLESSAATLGSPVIGDLWFTGTTLNFRKDASNTIDLLAGGGMAINGAISGATTGSVLYVNSSNQLAQDNANFFWDAASHHLGVGTTAPTQGLVVANGDMATLAQGDMRFYDTDNSNYAGFQAASNTTVNMTYTLPSNTAPVSGYALVSDTSGNLSWAAAGGLTNPMTNQGDMIYGGAAGAPTRLAPGASNYVLTFNTGSSAPQWAAPGASSISIGSSITGAVGGSILFANTANQFAQNPSDFFWDEVNKHLGIGTSAPSGAQVVINEADTDPLMILQRSGVNKLVIGNDGGVTVNSATANIAKTANGDFTISGYTSYNSTAVQDTLNITEGAAVFTTSPATAATFASAGAGSHSIVRDDGKILIIHGNSTATASLWDGSSSTMSSVTVAGANVSAGAISLRRPDGRYLLLTGVNPAASYIFDPMNTAAAPIAGPTPCSNGYGAGTNAFLRTDGRYVIMCGGQTNWGIYDPVNNNNPATASGYLAGTVVAPATFNAGAMALQRDDNTFMILFSGGNGVHAIYNANQTTNATTSPWSSLNVGVGQTYPINAGAVSVRRNDGKFLILGGGASQSMIYDPVATMAAPYGTFSTSPNGPAGALGDGAQIVWRQDGKYILLRGGGTTDTYIVDPVALTFTAGTALPAAASAGSHLVVRPDGKYQFIRANGSGITDTINIGFQMGGMVGAGTTGISSTGPQLSYWESECMSNTSLNPTSTISWNANQEGYTNFQVRTGTSCSAGGVPAATYRDVQNNGDEIGAAGGDNKVQVRIFFRRDFPTPVDQEWGLWRGLNQTKYRRKIQDPAVYDFTINNSSLFHRNQFDMGLGVSANQDSSGPVSSNVNVAANGSLQLLQGVGNSNMAAGTTPVGSAYAGAFLTHTALNTPAGEGSITMKRPDGRYMMIVGGTAAPSIATAEIYDPSSMTFTNNTAAVYNSSCSGTITSTSCVPHNGVAPVSVGRGSLAFKRPDGKFLVVLGQSGTTGMASTSPAVSGIIGSTSPQFMTNIYDPVASTFATGPSLQTVVGATAPGRGSFAIPLPNGNVLLAMGNYSKNTVIYNPTQNTVNPGPDVPVVVGLGSIVIPRPDGAWLVLPGSINDSCGPAATAYVFDPYAVSFTVFPTAPLSTGAGAMTFQRSDGNWVILRGAFGNGCPVTAAASYFIYNTQSNRFQATGSSLATAIGWGAQIMQRPDGSWLIMNGNNTSAAQIYQEKAGVSFEGIMAGTAMALGAGVSAPQNVGDGSYNFQLDNGRYISVAGMVGATGTSPGGSYPGTGTSSSAVVQYDAGWVTNGMYRTEQMNIPDLDANSTLSWKTSGPSMQGISAEVRTATSRDGLQTATSRDVSVGGLINPGASETWIQINFNFKRSFPGKEGIWSDVWMGGSGIKNQTWRTIANPTLVEFQINKDKDLLDLQADGLSLFRVSSNGDIYTSANGSVRTGGADLAENYSSSEELQKGEVVSIDPIGDHNVRKSLYQNQPDVLGVVSSDPGFVAGSYTKDSYPIALVGRVPVKVSTENGMIHAGDYLTAASVPGHAMRATMAGRVIGKALQDLDPTKLTECPASDFPMADRKCGEIVMFVNLTDYAGVPVEKLMSEMSDSGQTIVGDATHIASNSSSQAGTAFGDYSKQGQILDFLQKMKDEQINNPNSSEILTGRLSATKEIIAPSIFTDTLVAKTIRADHIEGLEFIQTGMAETQDGVAVANTQIKNVGTELDTLKVQMNDLLSKAGGAADSIANSLKVFSLETQSGIKVGGQAEFQGPSIFKSVAEFFDKTIFHKSVEFEGQVTFNKDSAGYAIVKKGLDSVEVKFEQEYPNSPIINTSLSLQQYDSAEVRQAAEELLLVSDVKYIITNVTTKGFTIRINQSAVSDIPFSWEAFAVKDAQTFGKDVAAANSGAIESAQATASSIVNSASQPSESSPSAPTHDSANGNNVLMSGTFSVDNAESGAAPTN